MRRINAQEKWDHIRDKVHETSANIVSLQETKRQHFDRQYLARFCPRYINHFAFSPSDGASGGLLTAWNHSLFQGEVLLINTYSITIKFTDQSSGKVFHHTNVYGSANASEKAYFISWLYNFDTTGIEDWILMGDFNLIRGPENRSRPGGSTNDMLLFNDMIHHLDLVDIAFEGKEFS